MSLTFGSLFAGIGGFDLGFERAGMKCVWQVEIDGICQRILAQHWPHVRRWDDIRTFTPSCLESTHVDVVCGGFPCQDLSCAGLKEGIDGLRSGLWREFARVLRDLLPAYAVVENVAALTLRGLDRVLGDLAALGYAAEWARLSAAHAGAPHLRRRIFIVAHSRGLGRSARSRATPVFSPSVLAQERPAPQWELHPRRDSRGKVWAAPVGGFHGMDDGVSSELDHCRMARLGAAVVPAIAEWVGRCVVRHARAAKGGGS